jgi:hypothetical protein
LFWRIHFEFRRDITGLQLAAANEDSFANQFNRMKHTPGPDIPESMPIQSKPVLGRESGEIGLAAIATSGSGVLGSGGRQAGGNGFLPEQK